MTAPEDKDPFGRGISSHLFLRKLKKINPKIWSAKYYTAKTTGMGVDGWNTCLWVGPKGNTKHSRKISGYVTGVIPEFTQIGFDGKYAVLGWRRILQKAIKRKAIRAIDAEVAFSISMEISGTDSLCISCTRMGKSIKATSKNNQCDFHRNLLDLVAQKNQQKSDKQAIIRSA